MDISNLLKISNLKFNVVNNQKVKTLSLISYFIQNPFF